MTAQESTSSAAGASTNGQFSPSSSQDTNARHKRLMKRMASIIRAFKSGSKHEVLPKHTANAKPRQKVKSQSSAVSVEVMDEDAHVPPTRQTLTRRMSSAMLVFKHKTRFNFKADEKHTDKVIEGYKAGLEARIAALEATLLVLQTNNKELNEEVYILKKGYLDLLETSRSIQVPTVEHPTLPAALSQEIKRSCKVLKPTKESERNDRLDSLQARIALGRKRQLWL
jgi:hypothetical protein